MDAIKMLLPISLLLLLFHPAMGFIDPSPFLKIRDSSQIWLSSFTDSWSKEIHILFDHEGTIMYLHMKNESIMNYMNLTTKKYYKVQIAGKEDGKNVYIAIGGYDQLDFLESDDNGYTWTNQILLKGMVYYSVESLINIYETGRIYMVLYGPNEVIFVTRPPNSKIFTKETTLIKYSYILGATSAYTNSDNQAVIHVVYIISGIKTLYVWSDNNGNTWSNPIEMHSTYSVDVKLLSNPRLSNAIFMIFNYGYQMRYSLDHMNTFSDELTNNDRVLNARICGTETKKSLVVASISTVSQWTNWEENKAVVKRYNSNLHTNRQTMVECNPINPMSVIYFGRIINELESLATSILLLEYNTS